MTASAFIEPPVRDTAPDRRSGASRLQDAGQLLAALPPLLSVVPVAGPAVFVYVGFGVVLLLLLVPPLALLATLAGVAFVVVAALVALGVAVVAIVKAPFLLARRLPGRRFALPVQQVRSLKVRRV
jgi:hypothetical protein